MYDMDALESAYIELQKQRDQRCSFQVTAAVKLARTVKVSPQMTNQRQEQSQRSPPVQVMQRQANLQPEHRLLTALKHCPGWLHILHGAVLYKLACLIQRQALLLLVSDDRIFVAQASLRISVIATQDLEESCGPSVR